MAQTRQIKTFETVAYQIKPYMAKIFAHVLKDEEGKLYLFSTNGDKLSDKICTIGTKFTASYIEECANTVSCFFGVTEYHDLTIIKNIIIKK